MVSPLHFLGFHTLMLELQVMLLSSNSNTKGSKVWNCGGSSCTLLTEIQAQVPLHWDSEASIVTQLVQCWSCFSAMLPKFW